MHVAQRGPRFQQVGGEGVTKRVRMVGCAGTEALQASAHRALDGAGRHRLSPASDEQGLDHRHAGLLQPAAVLFQRLGWVGLVEMLVFITVLTAGLIYCWKKGALEWQT